MYYYPSPSILSSAKLGATAVFILGTIFSPVSQAQSEEKTFKSVVSFKARSDACASAKEVAQRWLKENTDRSHPYFLSNQMLRKWPAKSDGTKDCDCSKVGEEFSCAVDASISILK